MSSPEYEQLVRFLGPRFDTIDRRFDSVDRKFEELRAELLGRLRSSS